MENDPKINNLYMYNYSVLKSMMSYDILKSTIYWSTTSRFDCTVFGIVLKKSFSSVIDFDDTHAKKGTTMMCIFADFQKVVNIIKLK